jgi:lipopolysaccharide/colanic/teichoic acid biosynthesis glycosyltransferase
MKVVLDILLAAIILCLILPFLVVVAALIFFMDFKSPFFIQERIGAKKLPFNIVKFRTMTNGEVTFVGKVLRRTGIDELPQLWNIIFMEMSFVGPRPLTQGDIERLEWTSDYYSQRWDVKPGIVGLAQLAPICHKKMSWFLDLYYIKNNDLILDAKVFCSSLLIPFVGKAKVKEWMHKK